MSRIQIDHYSDVLCIWAYISERRMEEVAINFKDRVDINFKLFPVFGDVPGKIENAWSERGGLAAYNQHVQEVANKFDHLSVHPDIWVKSTPYSSLPGHLYLCAVQEAESVGNVPEGSHCQFKKHLKDAFFQKLADISNQKVLDELLEETELPVAEIQQKISSGAAFARMSKGMQEAKDLAIQSSPTLLFNEGRQRLTGNVGYKIIEANIRELLEHNIEGQSWC